jgi:hypothetical protein
MHGIMQAAREVQADLDPVMLQIGAKDGHRVEAVRFKVEEYAEFQGQFGIDRDIAELLATALDGIAGERKQPHGTGRRRNALLLDDPVMRMIVALGTEPKDEKERDFQFAIANRLFERIGPRLYRKAMEALKVKEPLRLVSRKALAENPEKDMECAMEYFGLSREQAELLLELNGKMGRGAGKRHDFARTLSHFILSLQEEDERGSRYREAAMGELRRLDPVAYPEIMGILQPGKAIETAKGHEDGQAYDPLKDDRAEEGEHDGKPAKKFTITDLVDKFNRR